MKNVVCAILLVLLIPFSEQITGNDAKYSSTNRLKENRSKLSLFTQAERDFIATAAVIKVGFQDREKVIFFNKNQQIKGLSADLFQRIEDLTGLKFHFERLDNNLLETQLVNKELDLIAATNKTLPLAKLATFSRPFYADDKQVFINKNNPVLGSAKDLAGKKIAIKKDYITTDEIYYKLSNVKVIETQSSQQSISLLMSKKVTAIIGSKTKINNILRENFITTIKPIDLDIIDSNNLYIATIKPQSLLQSIIDKSLNTLTNQQMNELQLRWFKTDKTKRKKNIRILLNNGREPYTITNHHLKGFEYELVKSIFSMSNISIDSAEFVNSHKNQQYFKDTQQLDVAVSVKSYHDQFYYSDIFINYETIVVSKKSKNLFINEIKDLDKYRIGSSPKSYKDLGQEYYDLYNPLAKPKTYQTYTSAAKKVEALLNDKTDAIVVDKRIFLWYLKKYSTFPLTHFKLDYVFPKKDAYKVAFKDKNLRNLFNTNLKIIRNNGIYQQTIDKYIETDILSKVAISAFSEAILAKFIFDKDIPSLQKMVNILTSLKFINEIQVFDNIGNILIKHSETILPSDYQFDSIYGQGVTTHKVGSIRISFNDEQLAKVSSPIDKYPSLALFKGNKSYSYIKRIYEQHGVINNSFYLTQAEKEYISTNPVISYSDAQWQPLSIIDKDKHIGIYNDYLKLFTRKTGLKFKWVHSRSRNDTLDKFAKNRIDFIFSLKESNREIGLVTNQFANFRHVIVTATNTGFINNIKDLTGKIIAVPKNHSSFHLLKKNYPQLSIITTDSVNKALELVAKGKAFAFVGHEAVAAYHLLHNYNSLKIDGVTELKYDHRIVVQPNHSLLFAILNKAIATLTYEQKSAIRDKWVANSVTTFIDYGLLYQAVGLFIFIMIIVLFFIRKLAKAKLEIEKANLELEEKNTKFESLFNDTTDAIILIRNGEYFDLNTAAYKLLGYKDKQALLNAKAGSISPTHQFDGTPSRPKMLHYLKMCDQQGSFRFEWLSKRLSGEIFWIEILLTKIQYDDETVIHMVCRDINETKLLQTEASKRSKQLEETNKELTEQKVIYKSLFSESSDGVSIFYRGRFIECNHALLKMLKYDSKQQFLELSPAQISPFKQPNGELSSFSTKKHIKNCITNGSERLEWVLLNALGEEFWVELVLTSIRSNKQNLIHFVWRDISTKKHLEEQDMLNNMQLQNSNNELQSTIENLKQTQNQLVAAEKMASLGGLVAGVAHEINTPVGISLTGITHFEDSTLQINEQFSNKTLTQNSLAKYLEKSTKVTRLVAVNLKKAAELVSSFKQIAVDQTSEEMRIINVNDYLLEILASMQSVTRKTDISINVNCPDDISINITAGAFSQIITNLIMNAINHAYTGIAFGVIQIDVTMVDRHLNIDFSDDGIGICSDNLPKIFNPFFTTNRNGGGSGLGLNIVYNIVTNTFHGNIVCKSELLKGTHFIISLDTTDTIHKKTLNPNTNEVTAMH